MSDRFAVDGLGVWDGEVRLVVLAVSALAIAGGARECR
jgi:hypothetical protein